MLIHIEPGGEKWLPWARRKAAALAALARELGLHAMTKVFKPDSGTLVYIKARADGNHLIHITAGSASRIRLTDVDGNSVDRFYRLRDGSLAGYGEAGALSFDGRSSVGYDGTSLVAERKNKARATDATVFLANTAPPPLSSMDQAHATAVREVWPRTAPWTNEAGTVAVAARGVSGAESPVVFALSSDEDSTLLAAASTSRPGWIGEFYSGQGAPQRLFEADEFSANTVVADMRASSAIGPYYFELVPADSLGVVGPGGGSSNYYAMYDRFGDQAVMYARLLYASSVTRAASAVTVVIGERHEVRAYDEGSGEWRLVYTADRPLLAQFEYVEDPSILGGATSFIDGVPVLQRAVLLAPLSQWQDSPVKGALTVYPASSLRHPLALMEVVRPIAADNTQRLLRNGVVVKSDVPINSTGFEFTPAMVLEARDGRVLHGDDTFLWCGAWGEVDLGTTSTGSEDAPVLVLSPLGERLYVHNSTWKYYESGVLKQTVSAVPTANAASFALYPAAPAAGFWFVDKVIGWLHDKTDTVKARVYTHITRTTIPGPPHIPPLPPVTVYTWQTSIVKLKYTDGALKAIETYSTTPIEVASRGPLEETLPGVDTVSFSDAELVQDALLPKTP